MPLHPLPFAPARIVLALAVALGVLCPARAAGGAPASLPLLFDGPGASAIGAIRFGAASSREPRTPVGRDETDPEFRRGTALGCVTNLDFTTRPFVMPKEPLRVNIDVLLGKAALTRGSYAMVEIINDQGHVVAGYEARNSLIADVDSLDHLLAWKERADTTPLAGAMVSLRFVMRDARLYAVHVRRHEHREPARIVLRVDRARLRAWDSDAFTLRGESSDGGFVSLDHWQVAIESSDPDLLSGRTDNLDVHHGVVTAFSDVSQAEVVTVRALARRGAVQLRSNAISLTVEPAPAAAPESGFKQLFLEPSDIQDPAGDVRFEANSLHFYAETRGLPAMPRSMVLFGRRVGGEYQVWGSTRLNLPGQLFRATTRDGINYRTEPVRSRMKAEELLAMTYSPAAGEYLAAERRGSPNAWAMHTSKDGFNFRFAGMAYHDHDAVDLVWDPLRSQFLAFQVTWERTLQPRIFGDNAVYLSTHLDNRARRVLSWRSSPDGLHWTPGNQVTQDGPAHWTDAKYLLGVPDEKDPPDLECYWTDVFPYGGRYLALVMFYAPAAPEFLDAYPYDIFPSKHGPHAGTEWMVSSDLLHWSRPVRGQRATDDVRIYFMHAPMELHDRLLFLVSNQNYDGQVPAGALAGGAIHESHQKGAKVGQNIELYGVRANRIIGVRGRAGASACTRPFVMPDEPLRLNYHGALSVAVLDEKGSVLPGYEASKCKLQGDDLHASLGWENADGRALAGKKVQLKFNFQDAVVYSLHTLAAAP